MRSSGGQGGKINLDDYVAAYTKKSREIWLMREGARGGSPRSVRRRPRSPEESAILTLLAKARLERALSSGELVRLGPRRYRLRVF